MTEPQSTDPSSGSSSSKGTTIALVAALVVVSLGALALWLTTRDDGSSTTPPTPSASPSITPSPSVTPSPSLSASPSPTQTAAAASLEDINGRWCSTWTEATPEDCVTVTLPTIVFDGFPDQPEVVYPPNADIDADPATYDYSMPPNTGGCWLGGIDFWPPTSGAPLMYCPAGADGEGHWDGMAGPADEDRLWPGFQEPGDAPYIRVDDE